MATEDPAAIAERASETIRQLCYGTRMTSPTDVSDILGVLETMAEHGPVICAQLAAGLDDEAESDRLVAASGPFTGDVPAAVATAAHWLHEATAPAEQVRLSLANAHVTVRGLASGI
jgi:hypothetical protein